MWRWFIFAVLAPIALVGTMGGVLPAFVLFVWLCRLVQRDRLRDQPVPGRGS